MKRSTWLFVAGGLLVAFGVAFFLSPQASKDPDGLNRVAQDQGIGASASAQASPGGALSGYEVKGVDQPGLSKGLAGLIGVAVTFGIALLLFGLLRRRSDGSTGADGAEPSGS